MKFSNITLIILISAFIVSCGNSEEQKRQRLKDVCDSISYYSRSDYGDRSALFCIEGAKLAAELNDSASLAYINYEIGNNLFAAENYDAACMHFDAAVNLARDAHSAKEHMDLCIYESRLAAYFSQIVEFDKSIELYEQAMIDLVAAKNLDPQIKSQEYIDSIIGRIHICQAKNLFRAGQESKANQMLYGFQSTKFANSPEGRRLYAYYLVNLNRFQEACDILEDLKKEYSGYASSAVAMSISDNLAGVYYELGRVEDAYLELENYERLRHTHNKQVTNNQLVFQCNNAEKELLQLETYKEREKATTYMIGAFAALALSLFFFLLLYVVWRRHRNYIRLQEYNKLQMPVVIDDEYLTAKINAALNNMKTPAKLEKKEKDDIASQTAKEIKEETYKKNAVNKYIEELTNRKLYCNPDFKREDLVMELNLRKSTFNSDFEYVTGESLTSYIQRIRLEHSIELMKAPENLTIETIALESGFSSRSTFYRLFSDTYGKSPTEYKLQISGVM